MKKCMGKIGTVISPYHGWACSFIMKEKIVETYKQVYGKFDQSTFNVVMMREYHKWVKAVNQLRKEKNGRHN